jgi:S1-C subfamily serine protease
MAQTSTQTAWVGLAAVLAFLAGIYAAPLVYPGLGQAPRPPSPTPAPGALLPTPANATPAPQPKPRPRPEPSITELYETLHRSVVNIATVTVTGTVRPAWTLMERFVYGPFINTRETHRSSGSGFVLDAAGEIVTNHHVIEHADEIKVMLADGRVLPAVVIGSDPRTDLALLRTAEAIDMPEVSLGDADTLRVGQPLLAIGNPFGLGHSLTTGVLSYKGRAMPDTNVLASFLQTDMPINPGNSGGPVFDLEGRLIGVNHAIVEEGQGISFAIPVDVVRTVIPALREYGRFEPGLIGVRVATAEGGLGAMVEGVFPGFPADRAGLRAGDQVIAVNDQPCSGARQLLRSIALTPLGQSVTLRILRDGEELSLSTEVIPPPAVQRQSPGP